MEDWHGGKPLSLPRSAGPPLTSVEESLNYVERGRGLMGSYWSVRNWHCVVVAEVVSGVAVEEEKIQRRR